MTRIELENSVWLLANEEREELDSSQYIYVGCGQYRYVGDEI